MRAGRMLAAAACVLAAWPTADAAAPAGPVQAAEQPEGGGLAPAEFERLHEEFGIRLPAFRAGDESQLEALRECVRKLRPVRPDLGQAVEFFAALSPADRARGLQQEGLYVEVWNRVKAAGAPRPREKWSEIRDEVLADLEELVRANRLAPDFTPAANALALHASILGSRVSGNRTADEATREGWIREGVREAEEALDLLDRVGLKRPKLEALGALATLHWAHGDTAAAEDAFEGLRASAHYVAESTFERQALYGLLGLAHEAGDLDRAAPLLDEIARLEAPKLTWSLAAWHGTFLLSIDAAARAAEFLASNRPAAERDLEDWHVLMAGALARKGDAEGARAHELVLQARNETNPVISLALVEALLNRGEFAQALEKLDALPPYTNSSALLRARRDGDRGTALLELGRREEARASFERALAIGDSLEGRLQRSGGGSATRSVIGEVVGLETVALLARAHIEDGDALSAAALLEDRQSRALRQAASGQSDTRIDTASLRAWAGAYEVGLATWVIGADTSVAVCVNADGEARGAVIAVGRRALENGVRRLREAVLAGDAQRTREYAVELQAVLLPPDVAGVFGARTGRLLLCAHGALERFPFEVLPCFETLERVPLVLPGLLSDAPGARTPAESFATWSLVGDPIDAGAESTLPGAREELAEAFAAHPAAVRASGASFDREALTEALRSGRSLHLATHLSSDRPKSSTLDSRLAYTAFELSHGGRFDIAEVRRARPALPLAFLSTCESGGGEFVDGEAALGMARAFLESGTRNLLVTQWPVEDGAARAFAAGFHRALLAGDPPSRAAARARALLRERGSRPADWAAFRLLGRD